MNRIRTLIAAAAIIGLSACTAQQRHIAANALSDDAATPVTSTPSVVATADCSTITFDVTGYPDGTNIFIGEGSQPPFGFTVGAENLWGFTRRDGGAVGTIKVGLYETTHSWEWTIDAITPDDTTAGNFARVVDGFVDCTG